ncbi:MAG: 5-dehydro-4-deoxy-D-glucuronate isomerase [Cytophagaceae bacterium]
MVESRYSSHPVDFKSYGTERIRQDFLISNLFKNDEISMVYSHYDRFIVGGVTPTSKDLHLTTFSEIKSEYFLERRELGIINIGESALIRIGEKEYILNNKECLYIGKGEKEVIFLKSKGAKLYLCSAPAHASFPVTKFTLQEAEPLDIGTETNCNKRTVYKFIHQKGIQSCQLVMGMTVFQKGSTWNTMPCHKHDRRMEAYLYFDLAENERVFHFMGEPQETRHILVANQEAILSPPWSVHFGTATSNYSFIWAMAGENKDYTDMDMIELKNLK